MTQHMALSYLAPTLAGVGSALPAHYYAQGKLLTELKALWSSKHHNPDRLVRLHEAVGDGGRYLALPMECYHDIDNFGAANEAFIEVGTELAEQALVNALASAV